MKNLEKLKDHWLKKISNGEASEVQEEIYQLETVVSEVKEELKKDLNENPLIKHTFIEAKEKVDTDIEEKIKNILEKLKIKEHKIPQKLDEKEDIEKGHIIDEIFLLKLQWDSIIPVYLLSNSPEREKESELEIKNEIEKNMKVFIDSEISHTLDKKETTYSFNDNENQKIQIVLKLSDDYILCFNNNNCESIDNVDKKTGMGISELQKLIKKLAQKEGII